MPLLQDVKDALFSEIPRAFNGVEIADMTWNQLHDANEDLTDRLARLHNSHNFLGRIVTSKQLDAVNGRIRERADRAAAADNDDTLEF